MFQAQNRETINSTWKLLCPSRSSWWQAWQDHVSRNNTRPARPRPQCARPRPSPVFFVRQSQTASLVWVCEDRKWDK